MENAAMIIVSAIMGFLILGIVLTIGGSMNRRCEVETILPSTMEKTVEGMPFAEAGCSSGELVIAECVELLAAEIDTDSDVVLKVYQNDVQKGVLSMKLQEKFQHPNGMEGTAEAVRTIIREERENVSKEQYRVRFYQNREGMLGEGSCYKVYTVEEGQCLQPPAEPGGNGVVFAGWHDWNDYAADFSLPIEENRDYYAAWE